MGESQRFIADGAKIELNTEMGVIHLDIPRGTHVEVEFTSEDGGYPVHVFDGEAPLMRKGPPSFNVTMHATPVLGAGPIRTWIGNDPDLRPSP